MMRLLIIVLSLLLTSFRYEEPAPFLIHKLIVQPNSTLTIDGKTNVNSFRCGISQYTGRDTLVIQEGGPLRKPLFIKGKVALQASRFDCGMQMMTQDFNTTLKSKEYPYIVIDFKSFERLPDYKKSEDKFNGTMTISLGGVSKVVDVVCSIHTKPSGHIHLSGGRSFLFSDFNLTPPEKMMGLIKIQQELMVQFNLVLLLDVNS